MENAENKVLFMCLKCRKIEIDKKNNFWLAREVDPKLYDRYIQKFEKDISHGYCPEHGKEIQENL